METFICIRKTSLYWTIFYACFILLSHSASSKSNRFITDKSDNGDLPSIHKEKKSEDEIQKTKSESEPDTIPNKVFTVVEKHPEFPGGPNALRKFLDENVKYPQQTKRKKGNVFVSLIITDQGNVSNVEVVKGLGKEYDKEAVRVVSSLPRWKPGLQSGIPVNVKYNLGVHFNKK